MDLSILIVTYNSAPLIGCLLDHLQRDMQTHASELKMEVVLVDNHSADCTAALVAAQYPWVKLVASPVNLGFAAGNNLAARQASGKLLLLLNPDAVPEPGALAQGVRLMQAQPEVGLGGGELRDPSGAAQPSARMFPSLRDEFFTFSGLAHRFPNHPLLGRLNRGGTDSQAVADVDWIPGAFVFIRQDAFEQLGGFDERYFMYYEEVDLCRALQSRGWRVRYWPELKALHIGGASARTVKQARVSRAGSQLELWRMRSALLYYRKHHGAWAAGVLHAQERGWFLLRRLRSLLRGQGDKAQDLLSHSLQLRQAWRDTRAGRMSPPRPW